MRRPPQGSSGRGRRGGCRRPYRARGPARGAAPKAVGALLHPPRGGKGALEAAHVRERAQRERHHRLEVLGRHRIRLREAGAAVEPHLRTAVQLPQSERRWAASAWRGACCTLACVRVRCVDVGWSGCWSTSRLGLDAHALRISPTSYPYLALDWTLTRSLATKTRERQPEACSCTCWTGGGRVACGTTHVTHV